MKERILLTGKNGQLGRELQRSLAPLGELVAVDVEDFDLAEIDSVRSFVRTLRPRIIVNAAAYTAVDEAETEPALAMAINALAPGVFGEEAASIGAWVVHYSTDYVFDGTAERPYSETDTPNPLNVYAKSKRAGELALQASGAQHVILRTGWVLSSHAQNFAKTILRLAVEQAQLNVVVDQFGAPTSAQLVADMTAHLIRQEQTEGSEDFPFGLYHLVAAGETNWYEYARYIIAAARAEKVPLLLAPDDIQAVKSKDYLSPAVRPSNSRLSTDKFCSTFGLPLPHWQSEVDRVLQQIFMIQRGQA